MDYHFNKVKCRKIEGMMPERIEKFRKLLEMTERYRRKNQWE